MGVMAVPAEAQRGRGGGARGGGPPSTVGAEGAPSLGALIEQQKQASDFRVVVVRYQADLQQICARYDIPLSPVRLERERRHVTGWLTQLNAFDARTLNAAGQTEYAEFKTTLEAALTDLASQERQVEAMRPLLPFVRPLQMLQEARRDRHDVDGQRSAQTLEDARKDVLRLTAAVAGGPQAAGRTRTPSRRRGRADAARLGDADRIVLLIVDHDIWSRDY